MSSRDGLRWTPDRRQALVALLSNDFKTAASIEELVDTAGISRECLPTNNTIGERWNNLVDKLLIRQKLDALLEVAFAKSPTLEGRLAEADAALAPPPVGNPADAYQVRLIGFAKKPLINRRELRTNFKQFIDEQAPVLVVRGPARSGKSFSYELMLHVARSLGRDISHHDFSLAANGNEAIDLILMIARRLGIDGKPETEPNSTAEKRAAELANWFVGVYRSLPADRPRILVIDGLNRIDLKPDVQSLSVLLAAEVIKGGLGETQLVLTGYDGSFDRDLVESLLIEEIVQINRTDVRLFFDGLDCDPKPSPEQLDDLVDQAMPGTEETDALDELAGRVRSLALTLMGRQ